MTEQKSSRRLIIAMFAVATVVAAFSYGAYQGLFDRSSAPTMTILETATVLPMPMILPEFSFVDHDGAAFGPERMRGHWSLVFFGFANCGHVCPVTLRTLSAATAGMDAAPRIVFVSVDPGRDTPDVLARYVAGFGGDMVGVSGDDAQIRKLASALGVAYTVSPGPGPYIVEHSPAVFVLDPEGHYRAVITTADDAEMIAADLREIMDI